VASINSGLKLKMSKNNGIEKKFFSIVTVTYNASGYINKTLNSILSQSRCLYEVIVIDGASTDGTIEKINAHEIDVDVLVSEPDRGIYDAMNKAVKVATGDYIIFMNAGDCFYDENTLSDVYDFLSKNPVDLYAGSTRVVYSNGAFKEKKTQPINSDSYYTPVCHQSLYAKTELMKKMPFDFKNYKIAADFDFMMKVVNANGHSFLTELPLSQVTANGVSDISRIKVWREYESIYRKYNTFGFLDWLYYRNKILVQYLKMGVKNIIKKIKL